MRRAPLALLLALVSVRAHAVEPPDSLGWDPAIRRGTLDNGLSYLVERVTIPPGRIEVRLIVAGGSSLERDDERGLAHLLEHMAFNGSQHFAPGELDAHFAKLGLPGRKDINALTSEDRVYFTFAHPSTTAAEIAQALDILADFAGGATLSDREIEAERGVVLAEWRNGLGPETRFWDAWRTQAFAGAAFATRDPIGLPEVIAKAPVTTIRDAYRRWYRPDLMTVAVVGDIEPDGLVSALTQRLGRLHRPSDSMGQPRDAIAADRRFVVATRAASAPTVFVALLSSQAREGSEPLSPSEIRKDLALSLTEEIVAKRLRALGDFTGSPVLQGDLQRWDAADQVRGMRTLTLSALARAGRTTEAAAAIASILEATRDAGFTQADLDAQRGDARSWLAGAEGRASVQTSAQEADAIVEAWLEGEPKTAAAEEAMLLPGILDALSPDDLTNTWRDLVDRSRIVVMIACPEAASCPTRDELEAAWSSPNATPGAAMLAATSTEPADFIPNPPPPGAVVKRRRFEAARVEEMRLSNGMTLLFRDAVSDIGRMRLAGTAAGGTLGLDGRTRAAADMLGLVLAESGTADHSPAFNSDWMKLTLEMGVLRRRMTSGCPSQHLGAMMQVIHAAFVRPAYLGEALAAARESQQARALAAASDDAAMRAFDEIALGTHVSLRPPSSDASLAVELDDLRRAHDALLSDPSEWTLAFVGSVDMDEAAKLAATWLASIPRPEVRGQVTSTLRPVMGRRTLEIANGDEERSQVVIGTRWAREPGLDADLDLLDASAILSLRLVNSLREERSAIYEVDVNGRDVPDDGGVRYLVASFYCEPSRRHELAAVAEREMRAMSWRPLDATELTAIREAYANNLPAQLATDDMWIDVLPDCRVRGFEPDAVIGLVARGPAIHARTIPRIADGALVPRDTIVVTTVPVRK